MNKIVMNERGFSLVIVLFTLVIITVLGVSILTLNSNSLNISQKEQVDQSAFYIAESGLTYRLLEIESEVNHAYSQFINDFNEANSIRKRNIIDAFPENFYDDYLDLDLGVREYNSKNDNFKTYNSEAKVNISGPSIISEYSRQYTMTSAGKIEDKKRLVSLNFEINLSNPLPNLSDSGGKYAVHTLSNITISGSASINGPVASQNGVITINSPNSLSSTDKIGTNRKSFSKPDWFTIPNEFIGPQPLPNEFQTSPPNDLPSFLVDKYNNFQNALKDSIKIPYPPTRTEPPIGGGKNLILIDSIGNLNTTTSGSYTKNYTIEMNGDMRFNNFIVGEGNTITLNVGDYAKNLYIENLNYSGIINVVGSGKLNIYTKKYDAHNGNLYSRNDGGLEIHTDTYTMSGGWPGPTVGVLESGKIDIFVNNSFSATGNSSFNTNERGNVSIYYLGTNKPEFGESGYHINSNIYAPRAIVEIKGSRHVKGKIISKELIANGNSRITFGENNGAEIPASVFKKPNIKLNFIVEK